MINRRYIFRERTSNDAPFTIRDGDVLTNPMPYLTKQTLNIVTVNFITNIKMLLTQQEFFIGDGTRQTFTVGYPFNELPTVELNMVPAIHHKM